MIGVEEMKILEYLSMLSFLMKRFSKSTLHIDYDTHTNSEEQGAASLTAITTFVSRDSAFHSLI